RPTPFAFLRPGPHLIERHLVQRDRLGPGRRPRAREADRAVEGDRLVGEAGRARTAAEKLEVPRRVARLLEELAPARLRRRLRSLVSDETRGKREDAAADRRPLLLDEKGPSFVRHPRDQDAARPP